MTTMMILELGKDSNTREHQLLKAINKLEALIESDDAAELVLEPFEELIDDFSKTLDDHPFAYWSTERRINNTMDVFCQCSRIRNYFKYNIVVWEYEPDRDEDDPVRTDVIPLASWTETLPEQVVWD